MCDDRGVLQPATTGNPVKRWAAFTRIMLCLLLGMLPHSLWSQESGRFYGVVTDLGGSAVASAKVELENASTGLARETSTDASGNYEFLAVPVDSGYSVSVTASGFEKSVQTGFRL